MILVSSKYRIYVQPRNCRAVSSSVLQLTVLQRDLAVFRELCNIGYPSETHLKLKSREISFAYNLFRSDLIVLEFCTEHGGIKYHCRALCKILVYEFKTFILYSTASPPHPPTPHHHPHPHPPHPPPTTTPTPTPTPTPTSVSAVPYATSIMHNTQDVLLVHGHFITENWGLNKIIVISTMTFLDASLEQTLAFWLKFH